MLILCYDTETNGLPLFDQPSEDPRQPHIVQLAAALVDTETRRTVSAVNLIVRPDGWEIPDEVAAVHGITAEIANEVGVPEHRALDVLLHLWGERKIGDAPKLRVGHNEQFDARIIRIALMRYAGAQLAESWKAGRAECTARLATPIMKMPPTQRMRAAGRHHPKTPKLEEAFAYFTGANMTNAHNAMADVEATLAVYFAIQDQIEVGSRIARPASTDDGLSLFD